jgi:hypothetical protein
MQGRRLGQANGGAKYKCRTGTVLHLAPHLLEIQVLSSVRPQGMKEGNPHSELSPGGFYTKRMILQKKKKKIIAYGLGH